MRTWEFLLMILACAFVGALAGVLAAGIFI